MRYLSLFSGIEACTQAWKPLGWECVAVAEIEPNPSKLLKHHYPDVPNLGDVTQVTEDTIAALGHIDLVVFGSPCQDLSAAGKRKGLLDEHGNITRSGLFFTAINIAHWARNRCGARFALWENVPGAFSSNKGADFAVVVSHMAGLDDVDTPKNGWGSEGCAVGDEAMVEWAVLDAQWFGLAQRRKRVFALADFGDWSSRCPILLERESLRGDTPPSRKAGKTVAAGVKSGVGSWGFEPGITAREGNPSRFSYEVSPTLRANMGDNQVSAAYGIAGNIIGRAPDNGGNGEGWSDDVGYTLTTTDRRGVCYPINTQIALRHEALGEGTGLGIGEDSSPAYTLQAAHSHAVAFHVDAQPDQMNFSSETTATLTSSQHAGVFLSPMHVRRLTPTECERLQGFPDGYTDVAGLSDSPRYKALGNSMAVNVMRYIGQQIDKAINNDLPNP